MAVVELTPGAKQDLKEASDRYGGQRLGAGGVTFVLELVRCLLLIAEAPDRWPIHPVRRRSVHRIRRYVMQEYPYVLPYYVLGDTVHVLAVAHTSRRPSYWLSRLLN